MQPTKEQYIQLKTILKNYHFDNEANLYKLFKFAKQSGLRYWTFQKFSTYVKGMGVKSIVRREGETVQRRLIYIPGDDIWLKVAFPEFDRCPNCKGTGLIRIDLTGKK